MKWAQWSVLYFTLNWADIKKGCISAISPRGFVTTHHNRKHHHGITPRNNAFLLPVRFGVARRQMSTPSWNYSKLSRRGTSASQGKTIKNGSLQIRVRNFWLLLTLKQSLRNCLTRSYDILVPFSPSKWFPKPFSHFDFCDCSWYRLTGERGWHYNPMKCE